MSSPGLDPRFILCPPLQLIFLDKTTGQPMSAGVVTSYADESRTTKKPMYQITGSPGSYAYAPLPNPIELTGIGTFSDGSNNDIIPYLFPYEGTPASSDGSIELYFIDVVNSGSVQQFDRVGLPQVTSSSTPESSGIINYIPNGQFLAHNNIPAASPNLAGQISGPVTQIAQGGWTFERPSGSTATDFVTFPRSAAYTTDPDASPRYSLNVQNTVVSGDQYKDVRIKFTDVTKFADADSQQYTFAFTGNGNGGSYQVTAWIIHNYGAGGSVFDSVQIPGGTFTIGPTVSTTPFQVSFNFPVPAGTIGSDDLDNVQIALRLPTSSTFNITLSDFVLTNGSVSITTFPAQTNADMLTRGVAGWMPTPNPDGSDLYLPLRLTKQGLEFDHTQIGKIVISGASNSEIGELFCDGTSYDSSGYSSDGIPYSRLFNKIGLTWGNGYQYVSVDTIEATGGHGICILNNIAGSTTNIADGTPSTGFTFVTTKAGNSGYGINAYYYQVNSSNQAFLMAQGNAVGSVTAAGAGTTGFTVIQVVNDPGTYPVFILRPTNGAVGVTGGQYFLFSNTTTGYYVWFKKDGSGSDPGGGLPGRTGIEVDIIGTLDEADLNIVLIGVLNGEQVSTITNIPAGSGIVAGSYFIFYTTVNKFVVWFTKDGVGTKPVVSGTQKYIEVDILSSQTQNQVASSIQGAINSAYFGVPDLRNFFMRGWSGIGSSISDANPRYSIFPSGNIDEQVGSYQLDGNQSHFHALDGTALTNFGFSGGSSIQAASTTLDTFSAGITESRPPNANVKFSIKY